MFLALEFGKEAWYKEVFTPLINQIATGEKEDVGSQLFLGR